MSHNSGAPEFPELLLRSPNLGKPVLIRKEAHVTFNVQFAGSRDDLDATGLLDGRLFLQSLEGTRLILQDQRIQNVEDMADLPHYLRCRLIPLEILGVAEPVASKWFWAREKAHYLEYSFVYNVTLGIRYRHIHCVKAPQLFNFVHDYPSAGWYNVNFHAVYIHKKDWHDFRFIHVTDTHIAWRNEEIADELASKIPGFNRSKVLNWNEHLRQLIGYSNALHRDGEIDFILLTGDVVDYVYENKWKNATPGEVCNQIFKIFGHFPAELYAYLQLLYLYGARPLDNFEYFRNLVTAWESVKGVVVGEELEVPLFTVTGNHDYRLNEYPFIFELEWESFDIKDVTHYSGFGLEESEAIVYEGGLTGIPDYRATRFVEYYDKGLHPSYASFINADADYAIPLGKHKILCMDSGYDEGVLTGLIEYLTRDESGDDFVSGSPDSCGFSQQQVRFLKKQIAGTQGLVVVAVHAPMVNYKLLGDAPHHLMRETEHQTPSDHEKYELYFRLVRALGGSSVLKNTCIAKVLDTGFEPLKLNNPNLLNVDSPQGTNTGQWITVEILAGSVFFLEKWNSPVRKWYSELDNVQEIGSYGRGVNIKGKPQVGDLVGYYDIPGVAEFWERIDLTQEQFQYLPKEWSLERTRYFKSGNRDPHLGGGVTDHRFEEFVTALSASTQLGKQAELVLTGHTHRSIEYRVRRQQGELRYYHDFYLDNTLDRVSPPKTKRVLEPLNTTTMLANDWWRQHAPLYVQTLSIGPPPKNRDTNKEGGVLIITVHNDVIQKIERVFISDMKHRSGGKKSANEAVHAALMVTKP